MGSLTQLRKLQEEERASRKVESTEDNKTTGNLRKETPIVLQPSSSIILPPGVAAPLTEASGASGKILLPRLKRGQREVLLRGGENALASPLPKGYHAIGKNEVERLLKFKEEIIKAGICAFDYESDGDPDDEVQDPQDHELVGVSFAYQIGQAFYMPVAHDFYAANWDKEWFVENFLRPILEHPDVLIIAHNIKRLWCYKTPLPTVEPKSKRIRQYRAYSNGDISWGVTTDTRLCRPSGEVM